MIIGNSDRPGNPQSEARYSAKYRLQWVMSTVLVAFLLLISYFLTVNYFNALAKAERASLLRLAGIVNTLSNEMNGDAHEWLMAKYKEPDAIQSNQQDSLYLEIHHMLLRNYKANMLTSPIYTIVIDSSNNCYFGVTSAEKPIFRHPYRLAAIDLMRQYPDGAIIPRHTDEYGTWLSAFAAVRNRSGKIVAMVQANQDFDEFLKEADLSTRTNLLISVLVSTFFLILLVRILQPILKREEADKAALEAANSEIKRINDQLQISLAKAKGLEDFRIEMITNLSHDLRTPMASILGYLETVLLKKLQISATEQERFLSVALLEAYRLNGLVADLFDLSKLESGLIRIEPEPFNLAELAQDTLQKYQLQAEAKQIKLLTDFSPELPLVLADVRWTDRILQNLMDNALRYAHEDGFVKFTLSAKAGKVQVKVCNSGDPIPEAHLSNVFDRYFKSSNRKKDSTGLGLTIVKTIIDLHGERVWAESSDEVTTFYFTLPIFE